MSGATGIARRPHAHCAAMAAPVRGHAAMGCLGRELSQTEAVAPARRHVRTRVCTHGRISAHAERPRIDRDERAIEVAVAVSHTQPDRAGGHIAEGDHIAQMAAPRTWPHWIGGRMAQAAVF